jgi:hypothetical protein
MQEFYTNFGSGKRGGVLAHNSLGGTARFQSRPIRGGSSSTITVEVIDDRPKLDLTRFPTVGEKLP